MTLRPGRPAEADPAVEESLRLLRCFTALPPQSRSRLVAEAERLVAEHAQVAGRPGSAGRTRTRSGD